MSKFSDDSRLKIRKLSIDGAQTLEQVKLCFYNGQRIEDVNVKALESHMENLKDITKLINIEIKNAKRTH
jgi:hypothetical protein